MRRETLEETGVKLYSVGLKGVYNTYSEKKDKHYVVYLCRGSMWSSDVKNLKSMEPDKFDSWQWFSSQNGYPSPLLPTIDYIAKCKKLKELGLYSDEVGIYDTIQV